MRSTSRIAELPDDRLPAPAQAAAYFLVTEAPANVAKYARASRVRVRVAREDGRALVDVEDDGVGGADPTRGSGLRGLCDASTRACFRRAGLEVVAQAGTAAELLAVVDELTPDVAVVDIRMPPTWSDEGLVAAEQISERHPEAGVVLSRNQYVGATSGSDRKPWDRTPRNVG